MEEAREIVGFPTRAYVCEINHRLVHKYGGGWMPPDNVYYNRPLDDILVEIQQPYPYVTVKDKAAALAFTIIRQQVFHDGNKRTGLFCAWTFVRANGLTLDLSDSDSLDVLTEAIVYGESDYDTLLAWMHAHQDDR